MNLAALIKRAVEKRRELFSSFQAFRILDGVGDNTPNLYLDKLGPIGLVHLHSDGDSGEYRRQLASSEIQEILGIEALYFRQRYSDPAKSAAHDVELLIGQEPEQIVISEHDILYALDPNRLVNAGLFLDMREVRGQILKNGNAKKVLNLFCYTGSLGLAAYVGGAREVVQVDISKSILNHVKSNLELNRDRNISGKMRIIPEDALVFLQKEERRIERGADRYDLIIIDPPSFSRSARGSFKVDRDYELLLTLALKISAPAGELIITSNFSGIFPATMACTLAEIAKQHQITVTETRELAPPVDFSASIEDSISMRGIWIKKL